MRTTILLLLAATFLLMPAVPARAAQPVCLEAIFFDLGDTLVEAGGGGLFVVRAGVQTMVDNLQAQGYQLGIITNVPAGWTREDLEAVMADPAFLDEFDVLVMSSQAPAAKPNPAIYTHAHSQLPTAVPIGQTAFVGELLSEVGNAATNPTSGARATGMYGIHLSAAAPSPNADYTHPPSDMPGLVDAIEALCPYFADGFETGTTGAWS